MSCVHQGQADVARHVASQSHENKVKAVRSSGTLDHFTVKKTGNMSSVETKARRAEVKVATALASHNVPLAFADHLSPMLRDLFPDSEIAKRYHSAKTKTMCIITGALRKLYQEDLIEKDEEITIQFVN